MPQGKLGRKLFAPVKTDDPGPLSPHAQAGKLLGGEAVFIPIRKGSKRPIVKGWQCLTLAETRKANYAALLRDAPAIAVLLGPPSGNVIEIDFDSETAAGAFAALNPAVMGTLRTRGSRGCKTWFRIDGSYPRRSFELRDAAGQHAGEWRGGACYSIITGAHPSGTPYTVLTDLPVATIQFASIKWPAGWKAPSIADAEVPHAEEGLSSACGSRCSAAASGIGVGILYDRFIANHWEAKSQERNLFIKKAIPCLFHRVCRAAVLPLVMRYYDLNKSLFKDSKEQHRCEAEQHLKNVEQTYFKSLTKKELAKLERLRTQKQKDAMRICRDLAAYKSIRDDCEGNQFVMAYDDMAERLLMQPRSAYDLMKKLIRQEIVGIVRKGQKRSLGFRGVATVWEYLLSHSQNGNP